MTEPSPSIIPEKEKRLNAMIAEYLKRKDAGQDVNKDAMLKAYPDLADGLRSYFQGEAMMGENSPALAATKLSPVPLASDVRETLKPGAAQADTASEFGNRKFGRYQILRPLGEGAMGSVYLALDTTLDRQVALKVPKTEGTANAEFMARFTREAKAAAALKHANICSVYDAGEHEGTACITMDFIDGVPLSRFIGTEKLQSVDGILQMISIIADAVGHAHGKGVIHRDLKPGNILVDADFKPHVTDFGLARRAGGPADESRITQEGLLIGTPAYMAPEQVKGEQSKVGPRSDIYSLGVILFELLTCRLPFEGKVPEMLAKVLRDDPPVPSRIRKDLTEDVDDLCLKMLQKNPERRFPSIPEVVSKIENLRKKLRETSAPSSQATAQQKSPFEIQKAHIELMLKKGQYAAAIQDLEKLTQETLPGAKAAAAWATAKLPIVKKEAKALSPFGLEALLKTAQQMFQKSDYVGCAQLIEEIPPLRRTDPMEDLLDKAKRREAEADQLLLDIKDKERQQDVDGLEPLVRKLLKLKPGNAHAKRLSEALQSYSKTPPTRRKYRYEKGRLQPMPEPGFLRQWAVLGSLVGILVFLSVYSYVIFYLKSGNQTLAVHVDDEWLKSQGGEVTLVVDGDNHTITTPSTGGDPVTVTVSLGQHTFTVKHGDTIVHDPRQFTIEKDGRKVLSITATDVRLENGLPASQLASESVASNNFKPAVPPLAIAPFDADQAKQHQEAWATHLGQPVEYPNSIGMKLRLIPPGEFIMGSPDDEPGRDEGEKQHRVRISKPFYMGAHEVTRAQFEAFVKDTGYRTEAEADGKGGRGWDEKGEFTDKPEYIWRTPGFPQTDTHPVVHVSWNDAVKFTEWLSEQEKAEYRLPTEAEWEFACRAGSTTMYSNGNDPEKLVSFGNIADASILEKHPDWTGAVTSSDKHAYTAPVGTFQGNAFELYDLHGNVWEWCQDRYDSNAYKGRSGTTVDPLGKFGDSRCLRDGGWSNYPEDVRAAGRNLSKPAYRFDSGGFRVVLNCGQAIGENADAANASLSMTTAHSVPGERPEPITPSKSSDTINIPDPGASLKNISQVHGATAEALVAWAKTLPAAGYRPYWFSVQANTTPVLYDALATKTADQSEWIMQFYDHADWVNWAEMKSQYRPALLNVYAKDEGNERLVLWIKGGRQWEYWNGSHGLMEEKLNEGLKWDQGAKSSRERWLLTSVAGHWFEGSPNYDMLMAWLPYHQCEWSLDLPLDELPALIETYRAKGWQPANLNIINGSSPARCSAVFGDNPENRKWTFSPGLSVNEYRSMLTRVDEIGGQPQCVFSRVENDEVVYSILWHGVEL